MNDFAPVNSSSVRSHAPIQLQRIASNRNSAARANTQEAAATNTIRRGSDRVDLSASARLINKLKNGGPVRNELVAQVRSQIENGSYNTPDKIDAAINELLTDL